MPVCALFLLLLGYADSARADQPEFLGPIETTNQRPYQLLFLSFAPESGKVLAKGRSSTGVKLDFGFDYLDPSPNFGAVVKEETETERLEIDESRGFGNGWEATLAVPIVWRDGGFLGALVGPYHDLIHFNDPTIDAWQGRGHDALFHSIVYDQLPGGKVLVDAGPAFGLGDVSGYVKKSLLRSEKTGTEIAARAGLKLPTGNAEELLGSGAVDAGIDLDVTQRLTRRIALHGNWSRVWMQKPTYLDNYAHTVGSYSAAFEVRAWGNSSVVIQSEGTETTYRTGNSFADGAPRIAGVGYKWVSRGNTVWTTAFTEGGDYQTFHWPGVSNIGPDFVVTIDMVRTH